MINDLNTDFWHAKSNDARKVVKCVLVGPGIHLSLHIPTYYTADKNIFVSRFEKRTEAEESVRYQPNK